MNFHTVKITDTLTELLFYTLFSSVVLIYVQLIHCKMEVRNK